MKFFCLFSFSFLSVCFVRAQDNITVCGAASSATATFARFASETSFRNLHPLPAAYKHTNAKGKEITFTTPDGKEGSAYFIKASGNSDQYLLVIHEWWGLNDHIKKESDKLFASLNNVNVMALDLYDGQVATTHEEAGKLVQSVKEDRAKAIINGAIAYAGKGAEIATIGWCFGGGWSLQATILAGEQAAGCVMYYGMPVQDMEEIKQIKTDVLGIFAAQDGRITPEVARDFEDKMEAADKNIKIKIFDAGHGFANPSGSQYNEAAAQEANKLSIAFLKEHLQ